MPGKIGKTNRLTERQKMSGWNELEQNILCNWELHWDCTQMCLMLSCPCVDAGQRLEGNIVWERGSASDHATLMW